MLRLIVIFSLHRLIADPSVTAEVSFVDHLHIPKCHLAGSL